MAVDLVEALKKATGADLAAVRERRETAEKEVESLKAVERILDVRINGKQKRKAPQPKAASGGGNAAGAKEKFSPGELVERIFDVITEDGPQTAAEIAQKLGSSPQAVGVTAAKSPWFDRLDDGTWAIAKTGGRK
ncbi:MAG: hypothetical protein IMZ54_12585 [Acidobacteria bacterium]|nr:hypothetical protein [Acidobacteriota bacterium]